MRKFFFIVGVFMVSLLGIHRPAEAQVSAQTRVNVNADPNYRWHNGQWWYAQPNNTWMMWNGNSWVGAAANGSFNHPNGRYYYPPGYAYGPNRYNTGYRGYYNNGYYNDGYYQGRYGRDYGYGGYNYGNRGANRGSAIGGAIGGDAGAVLGGAIGGAIKR